MDFITHTTTNTINTPKVRPMVISFNPANGRISFNKAAVDFFGITDENSRFILHQDRKRPKDWYLEFTPVNDEAFVLKKVKSNEAMLCNIALCKKVARELNFDKATKFTICYAAIDDSSSIHAIITVDKQ